MAVKHILIAVDSSEFSKRAAIQGAEIARALGASVTLCYVIEELRVIANPDAGFIADEGFAILKKEAEQTLEALSSHFVGTVVAQITPAGDPREDIIATAKAVHADMIVVGTHGRTGLNHMLIGSVAEYVVRHSPVPVLVVPSK